jgi:hypothetical protein
MSQIELQVEYQFRVGEVRVVSEGVEVMCVIFASDCYWSGPTLKVVLPVSQTHYPRAAVIDEGYKKGYKKGYISFAPL